MPAMRITINTDNFGNAEAARKAVAERLPELVILLQTGEYVGGFVLGGTWSVKGHAGNGILQEGLPSYRAAAKWLDDNMGEGWTANEYIIESSEKQLLGDVDEL